MDKISFILNEKATIEKLLDDGDFRVKVNAAIIDGVSKRAIKILNSNAEILGTIKKVSSCVADSFRAEFLEKRGYSYVIKEEFDKVIKEEIQIEVKRLLYATIREEIKGLDNEVRTEINVYRLNMQRVLKSANFEKILAEEAARILNSKLSNI